MFFFLIHRIFLIKINPKIKLLRFQSHSERTGWRRGRLRSDQLQPIDPTARHRLRHGRHVNGLLQIRRQVRSRVRDGHRWLHNTNAPAGHKHGGCWRRLQALLPQWHVHRRTRFGVVRPGTCLLQERRSINYYCSSAFSLSLL